MSEVGWGRKRESKSKREGDDASIGLTEIYALSYASSQWCLTRTLSYSQYDFLALPVAEGMHKVGFEWRDTIIVSKTSPLLPGKTHLVYPSLTTHPSFPGSLSSTLL